MKTVKKSLLLLALIPLFSQTIFAEEGYVMTQNTQTQQQTLSQRQQDLSYIAALLAASRIDELKQAVNNGLNNGLTVAEVKDLMAQLYAYCGFPKSLNGLGVLDKVVKERTEKGLKISMGVENKIIEKKIDSLKVGTETQTKLTGGAVNLTHLSADVDYYLKAHLFGDIFNSSIFSWQEREIITVAALSAMTGTEPQRDSHIGIAKKNGVTDSQIQQIQAIAEKYKR